MNDFALLIAKYDSSLPTLTDGQYSQLQVDVNGRLLVQADVTVLVDFLGLNGAADNANILIVGTEDGTSSGTAHAVRLDTGGQVIISDGGSSITVDAVDLDIRDLDASQDNVAISDGTDTLAINGDGSINSVVTATDLDIRDLTHVSDSIKVGDGTDFLEVNADGSINVNATVAIEGSEQYTVTDALAAAGDGLEVITAAATPWVTVASYSHTSGTAYLYGWQFACDQNCQARIVTNDSVNDVVYKTTVNSSAMPGYQEHFAGEGRIEIAGAASLEIRVQIKKRSTPGGNANGSGSMHIRTI